MKAHFAAIALLAAGCHAPTGLPAQDLQRDPMVVTLPAETTLFGGLRPSALLDHPALLALAMPRPKQLRDALTARTGLRDLRAADDVRLGCGADGCVVLATGAFSTLDPKRLAATAPTDVRVAAHPRGLDLRTADGPFVMRRLTPHKLVLGDRRAVVAIARQQHQARTGGTPRQVDVTPLEGLVPPGDLWLAAHSPQALAAHISERLRRSRDPSAHQLAKQVDEVVVQHRDALENVEAIAASLTMGTHPSLQLRVRCANEAEARRLTALASARLMLPGALPASAQRNASITRHERIVAFETELDISELEREVSP